LGLPLILTTLVRRYCASSISDRLFDIDQVKETGAGAFFLLGRLQPLKNTDNQKRLQRIGPLAVEALKGAWWLTAGLKLQSHWTLATGTNRSIFCFGQNAAPLD
jgi:hypothetical protein